MTMSQYLQYIVLLYIVAYSSILTSAAWYMVYGNILQMMITAITD